MQITMPLSRRKKTTKYICRYYAV